jgi:transcriptional regulator with XRE-family HTH domain
MDPIEQVRNREMVSTQLSKAMAVRKLTPASLSQLSGISYQTILKAVNGTRTLTKVVRMELCKALAVDESWLLSYRATDAEGGPIPMNDLDWTNHQAKVKEKGSSRELLALRHGEVPKDLDTTIPARQYRKRLDKIPGRPKDDAEQLLRKELWARRLSFILAARKLKRNDIPGVSEQAVYNMLKGKQWPTHYTWKLLSERFGLSVAQLQGLEPISASEYLGQDIQDVLAVAVLKEAGLPDIAELNN